MTSFYHENYREYFEATAGIDPSEFLEPIASRLSLGATVLDIGCGAGRDLCWLTNRGFIATGFEFSPGLASLARDFSKRPIIQADFSSYDFSQVQFDALLLIGALVHIHHSEFDSVFIRISQALRAGGLVNLSLKEGDGVKHSDDGRVFTLWRPARLESIFNEHGFAILNFSRFDSALTTGDVWLNYILRK